MLTLQLLLPYLNQSKTLEPDYLRGTSRGIIRKQISRGLNTATEVRPFISACWASYCQWVCAQMWHESVWSVPQFTSYCFILLSNYYLYENCTTLSHTKNILHYLAIKTYSTVPVLQIHSADLYLIRIRNWGQVLIRAKILCHHNYITRLGHPKVLKRIQTER